MKNADIPAMPLTGKAYDDFAAYDGTSNTSYNPECQGLTKREYFAALAMQGLLAKHGYPDVGDLSGYDNPEELRAKELHYAAQDLADYSQICADELLWELEEFPYDP